MSSKSTQVTTHHYQPSKFTFLVYWPRSHPEQTKVSKQPKMK